MAIEKFRYLSSLGWLLQEYNFQMGRGFQVWKFHLKISLWEEKLASQGPWANFWRWRNFHTWNSAHSEILYVFLSVGPNNFWSKIQFFFHCNKISSKRFTFQQQQPPTTTTTPRFRITTWPTPLTAPPRGQWGGQTITMQGQGGSRLPCYAGKWQEQAGSTLQGFDFDLESF